jgi:hypothetical protein
MSRRPGSLIELIEKLLAENEDGCMLEEELVRTLEGMRKRRDSVLRSIEAGIRRGRFEKCIRADGIFICLTHPKVLRPKDCIVDHRGCVLSVLEDVYLNFRHLGRPTVKSTGPSPQLIRISC